MIMSTQVRNAQLQALATLIDAGNAAATLSLYTGMAPSGMGAITNQQLLVSMLMAYPCTSKIEYGVLTFAAIAEQMVTGTGLAGWARIADSTGVALCDLSVAVSGADFNLPTVDLIAGAYLRITGAAISGA